MDFVSNATGSDYTIVTFADPFIDKPNAVLEEVLVSLIPVGGKYGDDYGPLPVMQPNAALFLGIVLAHLEKTNGVFTGLQTTWIISPTVYRNESSNEASSGNNYLHNQLKTEAFRGKNPAGTWEIWGAYYLPPPMPPITYIPVKGAGLQFKYHETEP